MARAYSLANKHAKVARENAEAILRLFPDLESCRKGIDNDFKGTHWPRPWKRVYVCMPVCLFNEFFYKSKLKYN